MAGSSPSNMRAEILWASFNNGELKDDQREFFRLSVPLVKTSVSKVITGR